MCWLGGWRTAKMKAVGCAFPVNSMPLVYMMKMALNRCVRSSCVALHMVYFVGSGQRFRFRQRRNLYSANRYRPHSPSVAPLPDSRGGR